MKRFPSMLLIAILAFVLTACQSGSGPSAEKSGLAGTWEAELGTEKKDGKTLKKKGKVTFSGNTYRYSWYKKLINEDGSTVYDWSETARETGSVSFAPEYMEWTANSYGTAEYNEGTQKWSPVDMSSSTNTYAIYYSLEGDNKLTLKEDYNLDGDFEDVIGMPETVVYTKTE